MKTKRLLLCAAGLLIALTRAQAATYYVDTASTNAISPFTNWTNAAAVIQDAVDAAAPGDEIVVTNGVYQTGARAVYGMSNRVAVTKAVTVRSVNGPAYTSIVGHGPIGDNAIRCAYLTNGAVLAGFTLTNGATQVGDDTELNWYTNQSGGGVWSEGLGAVASNCIVTGCSAAEVGGGVCGGSLNNCTLTGNSAIFFGGGVNDGRVNDCVITRNYADFGGGASRSTLDNCVLTGNSGTYGGGAVWSTLNNCTITGNTGYEGGGAYACLMNNCTLTGNAAYSPWWSETSGGGAFACTLNNCILYYNWAPIGGNQYGSTLNYSCTTPDPGGVGNITSEPAFVDFAGGNLRLQSNSPCINAGNNAYVTGVTDLDGNPRTSGGTVDIGAYEFQSPASAISYAWLQQFGLTTDGSADYVDTDHDGHNNWQEWMAGTDPTNALSVLWLAPQVITPTNVTLTWTSVTNRIYTLEQATNLAGTPPFTPLATNLPGHPGTTTFTDTNAVGPGPRFYRVSVE
jgi:hypothetical protein